MAKPAPMVKSIAVASSDIGLNIRAGKNLEAGSFWSGLIDDVKVYDRALNALTALFFCHRGQEATEDLVL